MERPLEGGKPVTVTLSVMPQGLQSIEEGTLEALVKMNALISLVRKWRKLLSMPRKHKLVYRAPVVAGNSDLFQTTLSYFITIYDA